MRSFASTVSLPVAWKVGRLVKGEGTQKGWCGGGKLVENLMGHQAVEEPGALAA